MRRAFYDFQVSPYSYDFVQFLVLALDAGCTEVVFVPGVRLAKGKDGKVVYFQKCSIYEQEFRLNHLLIPLCDKYTICRSREEAKELWSEDCYPDGYTIEKPVDRHLLSDVTKAGSFSPLHPTPSARAKALAALGDDTIVFTMRQSTIRPQRNCNEAAWIEAAVWLRDEGHKVAFIPDTDNPYKTFGDFLSIPAASVESSTRLAVYDVAMLNAGINTGPISMCLYSRRPLLYFKPINESTLVTGEWFWRECGLPPGTQPAWFNELQKIVWEPEDDAETIIRELKLWLEVKESVKLEAVA